MSWSGPVTGAVPFQQPPYGNGQPPYGQQPPFQHGQKPPQHGFGHHQAATTGHASGPSHPTSDNRLPKKKGNPIITRYPPPPGYRGPAQPQGLYGPSQYQTAQPSYPQGPPPSQAFTQHAYNAPLGGQAYSPQGYAPPQHSIYPRQPYPQAQNHQWPTQGYPSNHSHSQLPSNHVLPAHAHSPSSYQGYPSQHALTDSNKPPYGQAVGWPPQTGQIQYSPHNQHTSSSGPPIYPHHMADPNATPTQATTHLSTSQVYPQLTQPTSAVSETSSSAKAQLFLAWDDWDFDFDEAIWPKSNEPVDPNLSLGVIIWHPAKQMTRALPATFAEAEEQSLRPIPERLENGESVSMYFTHQNSHEAFLDVRQTDEWEAVRDDPVFVVFTNEEMDHKLVSLEDCIAQRDRPDEALEIAREDEDQEMHDATPDIMDNLEQALSGNDEKAKPIAGRPARVSSPRSHQEDILAKLGVTGAPKPPNSESLPSKLPNIGGRATISLEGTSSVSSAAHAPDSLPVFSRTQSHTGYRSAPQPSAHARTHGSMSAAAHVRPAPPPPPPPPPPPTTGQPHYDSWNAPERHGTGLGGSRASPVLSEGSNHTMAGSDFDSEKPSDLYEQEPSTVPSLQRSDSSFSRKRSYEDADHAEGRSQQQDDHSKRKRRSQVDAAYSRR